MKVALLILATVSACSAQNFTALGDAVNCLGLRLLPLMPRSEATPNVFYSPYSLSATMGMVYAGSRGSTQSELHSILGYISAGIAKDRVLEEYRDFAIHLLALSHQMLSTMNAAAYSHSLPLRRSYAEDLKNAFNARVHAVDFENNASAVIDDIDRWIYQNTRGYIKRLLDNPFPPSAKLVFFGIIHFKGVWETRFERSKTKKESFYNYGSSRVMVDMMYGRMIASNGYSAELSSAILDLPFEGGDYSMTIILPSRRTGIKKLRHLSLASLQDALKNLAPSVVKVHLPRFNFATRYFLRKEFAKLGVTRIFDPRKADLSGITGNTCAKIDVDEVVHKAVMHVDETGATAAAAAGTIIARPRTVPRVFRARHPFLFLIRKRHDNSILFIGEVNRL